ncbi:NAD(P)/FAD-dependent oxidoreductase [Psychroflexus tropicus]|uniref:NAD(P)/FAD-dependent oxidoreductase n=1 Tax=Psychroflexus tropicus TaxID=197345 RepID=UPI000372C548|nr:FAD-binding oxidoreductase [Psychroflexus tropicus]
MKTKDVLIVGFGIAGLTIAKQLKKRKKSFDIISDESQQSSKVAGGVLNPVALKRYKLAWKADDLMPEALIFYSQLNSKIDRPYFQKVPVFKLFSSVEDQNNWMVASDQAKLDPYLNPQIKSLDLAAHTPFKSGEVLNTHLLDLKGMLSYHQSKYTENNQFMSERFEYDLLQIQDDILSYKNSTYRRVIFCEGFGVTKNPFFNWLPLYGNKGEYLVFKSPDLSSNVCILKSRHFIIPLGNDLYKFGATYSREQLNDLPTESAKIELEESLGKMIDCNYEIVDQIAGVRPTVRDRKPILGQHPEHSHMYVLNGFGSRGVMAAPYLSRSLVENIYDSSSLDNEIDITRFLKFYA